MVNTYAHPSISFREYCRQFVTESSAEQTIRVLGYDWAEVFSDTTTLGRDILLDNGNSRLNFEVILVDPDSPMTIEKRAQEMMWRTKENEPLYPEGEKDASLVRLRTKIENSVIVAKTFQDERPKYFTLKLTPIMPHFSMIMRDNKVIGVFYALPWKGKDSVIFEAVRVNAEPSSQLATKTTRVYGTDFYGFLRGYFDALWQEPKWRSVQVKPKSKAP